MWIKNLNLSVISFLKEVRENLYLQTFKIHRSDREDNTLDWKWMNQNLSWTRPNLNYTRNQESKNLLFLACRAAIQQQQSDIFNPISIATTFNTKGTTVTISICWERKQKCFWTVFDIMLDHMEPNAVWH